MLDELKNIPSGKEFSGLLNLYKVVRASDADGYAKGYDRKKSAGWESNDRNSYGVVGYTHLKLSGAIQMLGGSYGDSIVQFKLLGGLKNFLFFDTDRDSEISRLQKQTYGREMSLYEQLYQITGDQYISQKYSYTTASEFGRTYQHELRKRGYYVRGIVCDYWGDTSDIVVYPFVFGDMIACAKATNLSRYMSESEVQKRFVGILDSDSRHTQERFFDAVPQLQLLGARDENGHFSRVGDKVYAPYETIDGKYNLAILDDENIVKPQPQKLFPDNIKLDEMPTAPSSQGNFTFKMHKMPWRASVKFNDEHPLAFAIPYSDLDNPASWFDWEYLEYMYQNPSWVNDYMQQVAGEKYKRIDESVEEAFRQGMSYDDFVANNKAIGYVCTHKWSVDSILSHGFSREWAAENDKNMNGGTGFYGDGVYGSIIIGRPDVSLSNTEMKDAGAARLSYYRDSSKQDGLKYGDVIIKCSIIGGWNNFLIFDKDLAQRVYKNEWTIEQQVARIIGKDTNAIQHLLYSMGGSGSFRYDVDDYDSRTTQSLAALFRSGSGNFAKWETFFKKYGIRGAIYHGGNDGYAFVCYDYSEVVPIAVSYDHGKTFVTDGIDWESTHDRIAYGGDPVNKIGHLYKSVSRIPKRITCNGETFGCVNVETNNGKFNCVRTDTWKKIFPIDFDVQPTIGINGKVRFTYRGYNLEGVVVNEYTRQPSFKFPAFDAEYEMSQLDEVIDYYENAQSENYQVQDEVNNQELQEQFFKTLDRIELV